MKNILYYSVLLVLTALTISSCLQDQDDITKKYFTDAEMKIISEHLSIPNEFVDYKTELPRHIGAGAPNPIHSNKALLGRVLFHDKNLSANGAVSCESCHHQEAAFADDAALSEGFDEELTKRNSLALGSVPAFQISYNGGISATGISPNFFWDERASSIQEQSKLTIQDDIEMGMDLGELSQKLKNMELYQILFEKAYPDSPTITPDKITDALEEFVNALTSVHSKFDEGMNAINDQSSDTIDDIFGIPFFEFHGPSSLPNYTASENRGLALYQENCSGCHGGNMVTLNQNVSNNGLDLEYEDNGIGDLPASSQFEDGVFKVPFLRNIAMTGPYMHDGRFETLEEVIDHYSTGINIHPNLGHQLRDNQEAKRFNFNDQNKEDLIAFLNTLTDSKFLSDPRYSDPFKR